MSTSSERSAKPNATRGKAAKRKPSEAETIAMAIGWGQRDKFYFLGGGPNGPREFWADYLTQSVRMSFRAEARGFLRALRAGKLRCK